jgi:hypothetical protein
VVHTANTHLRLPIWMIAALKREAAKTDNSYQWLMRLWLDEQLKGVGVERQAERAKSAEAGTGPGHAGVSPRGG